MTEREQDRLDSRAKVIIAACEMIADDPASSLSVRAVAARAGVSMGSLRHHFPTQRALREVVIETIYDVVTPHDQIIHDESMPARDRLVQCLRQVLAIEVGEKARLNWVKFFDAFVAREPTDELRAAYVAMTSEGQRRVEHWLTLLGKEGVVRAGDVALQASYLNVILSGLSLERALPAEHDILKRETEILYTAVDSILLPPS